MDSLLMYFLLSCFSGWLTAFAVGEEPSVNWYIKSAKIVIGENLELFCNTSAVQNDCKWCQARWYGGPTKSLISLNGYPVDILKHQTEDLIDGFNLIITNLTKDDLHKHYSCSYGLHTHKKNLTLGKPFELHPNKNDITVHRAVKNGSMLNVTVVFLEVHPPPICSVYFNEEDLSSELKNESEKIGISYRIRFELQRDIKNHSCNGTLQIKCRVGFRDHNINTTGLNYSCERKSIDQIPSSTFIAIAICVPCVIFCLAITLIIGHKRVCKTCHDRHEPRKDDTSMKKTDEEATKNLMPNV